ncbi:sensor histidine kinase [Pedobacter psychroterrae]|uniref:histidine kinase n=1 Tax=Pedobacter psychroterrae TaxID=2530453 RepID=A0A4R0NLS7_9SPHI|nr:HAMP domain-containing sensor histidine kinase [Pedobacter psychroterrae]TCD01596.1 HAMP domain-containing histidine kinase [Pedobacter psychroterrae]
MKLSVKLVYFIAGSKIAVVIFFILLLPFLVAGIASQYTNYALRDQQRKVISDISKKGIDFYLQGDESFGSYNLLKEEYISLQPANEHFDMDTITTEERIVEQDTLTYRVLSYAFKANNDNYLLEIGKTTSSINQYNKPLQRIALYVLLGLIVLTIVADLIFTRLLISPLDKIIQSKLINRKFPFKEPAIPVKTTTQDFKYLDQSLIDLMDQINVDFEKEREFTANASHELMTPISILQNKMENLLAEEHVTEEIAISIIGMMKTLGRLKKISSSLLLISRIENEQFARTDEVKPAKLMEEILEEISHRMEEKGLVLNVSLSDNITFKNVNQDLLFQFFYNLINNAIKYNVEKGSISISDHLDRSGYSISIGDTGIGIAKEDLDFIFDRFRKTNLGENVGYGLGLSIVKSIAVYHGLDVKVDSVVGKGSAFTIRFPTHIVSA